MRISCKICRRLGRSVCGREKCAFMRKPYPPGVHGRSRIRGRGRGGSTEYGGQLREKQTLKFLYGLREAQFKNYVRQAERAKGQAGLELFLKKYNPPPWLALDRESREGKLLGQVDAADPSLPADINLSAIVEFYSR